MPTISETEADGWCSFVTDDLPPPSLPASAEIFLILERVKKKAPNLCRLHWDFRPERLALAYWKYGVS